MAVREDVSEIRAALVAAEQNPSRRSVRALHNLLAAKMVEYAHRLGLSDDDVVAFGGGTPKPPEDEAG